MLEQHTPWWIRGCAIREASAMNPDKHRQLGRLGVDVVLCECFFARAHNEKVQTFKFILAVIRERQV